MLNARRQAEDYAKALPTSDGWPPFVLVCDVGHCIEVYADFSGQGENYAQFPNRQGYRIYLEDLRKPEVCDFLRKVWLEPQYPTGEELAETAAVMSILMTSLEPLSSTAIATRFAQGCAVERRIATTISALARLGHLKADDSGNTLALARN